MPPRLVTVKSCTLLVEEILERLDEGSTARTTRDPVRAELGRRRPGY